MSEQRSNFEHRFRFEGVIAISSVSSIVYVYSTHRAPGFAATSSNTKSSSDDDLQVATITFIQLTKSN